MKLNKKIEIFVQQRDEIALEFAERLTKFCSSIDAYPIDIQMTASQDGRQTANIQWYENEEIIISEQPYLEGQDLKVDYKQLYHELYENVANMLIENKKHEWNSHTLLYKWDCFRK